MPFQVSYSSKKSELPEVTLLSAGADQLILCGVSTIFLEATVDNPANLVGHTLEWEQLTGPPATTTTPNQLTTSYPFSDTVDKVWRFYIDRGTPAEQFADTNVFHTPTSVIQRYGAADGLYRPHREASAQDPVPSASILAPPPSGDHDPDVPGVSAIKLVWDIPTFTSNTTLVGQLNRTEFWRKTVYNGTYTLEGTVGPTQDSFIGLAGYYIIRTVFDSPDNSGIELFYDTEIIRAVDLVLDGISHIVDDLVATSNKGRTTSVVRFTNEVFTPPFVDVYSGSVKPASPTVVNRFTFITNSPPAVDIYSGSMGSTKSINITRINQGGIGSGAD